MTRDSSSFDDYYSSDIFTGNGQFVVENYFFSRQQRELLFMNESNNDDFSRQPLHKSCFTSLQKEHYRFFCTTCKKSITNFLKVDYMFSLPVKIEEKN